LVGDVVILADDFEKSDPGRDVIVASGFDELSELFKGGVEHRENAARFARSDRIFAVPRGTAACVVGLRSSGFVWPDHQAVQVKLDDGGEIAWVPDAHIRLFGRPSRSGYHPSAERAKILEASKAARRAIEEVARIKAENAEPERLRVQAEQDEMNWQIGLRLGAAARNAGDLAPVRQAVDRLERMEAELERIEAGIVVREGFIDHPIV
jgi:hypothetical protein